MAAGLGAGVPQGARTALGRVDVLLVESLAGYVAEAPVFPVLLARLPPVARHAGALDAILHALVLRNFGVSHLFLDGARTTCHGGRPRPLPARFWASCTCEAGISGTFEHRASRRQGGGLR